MITFLLGIGIVVAFFAFVCITGGTGSGPG